MRAKDLMIPVQDYVSPDDMLLDAVPLLRATREGEECIGSKGIPVLDDTGKLIGILSMRDILKATFPFYMGMMDIGDFSWDGMMEEIADRSSSKRIGDIMSSLVITIDEDAPLMECVDHMIKHNIKRLPVVNGAGRVAGMLYERDVFFAVTEAMLHKNQEAGQ